MSEIMLNIRDDQRSVHGTVHGATAQRVVAALSADPASIDDLEIAVGRYEAASRACPFFAAFRDGMCDEPWDAGIVFIDLQARVVAAENSYFAVNRSGLVDWHDGHSATHVRLPYCLASDWLLIDSVLGWQQAAERRRQKIGASRPFDAREILYSQLVSYLVPEVLVATESRSEAIREIHKRWLTTARHELDGLDPRVRERDGQECPEQESHEQDRPEQDRHEQNRHEQNRHELRHGKRAARQLTPRDLLVGWCEHIDRDIEHQAERWSLVGSRPPGILRESHGRPVIGFGTHEIVLYYDLVRYLLEQCWDLTRSAGGPGEALHTDEALHTAEPSASKLAGLAFPGECHDGAVKPIDAATISASHHESARLHEAARLQEVARAVNLPAVICTLEKLQQEWLHTPQHSDLGGRTPAQIMALERARLPLAVTGVEAMADCDCPICQAMADDDRPMFVHFDTCHCDDDFVFSLHSTREQWQAERSRWEELERLDDLHGGSDSCCDRAADSCGASRNEDNPFGDAGCGPLVNRSSVWKTSYSDRSSLDDLPYPMAVQVALLGVGAHLSELCEDLRGFCDDEVLGQDLRKWYANLRAAIGEQPSVLTATIARFVESLDDVSVQRDDLRAKCDDLEDQLLDLEVRFESAKEV